MKNIIITIVVLLALGFGFYSVIQNGDKDVKEGVEVSGEMADQDIMVKEDLTPEGDQKVGKDQEEVPAELAWSRKEVIGTSVEGKDIIAYHYGTGSKELLFVGGIHGGYSWNTAAVAYGLIDYIEDNEGDISKDIQVTVIPVLNPDGLSKVAPDYESGVSAAEVSATPAKKVAARFNANNVDLNRNFDCEWQSNAKWQNKDVSGGTQAFSEPEARALRDYVGSANPQAVVAWYSAAGGVYSSNCRSGVLPETSKLTELYAKASGYTAYEEFDYYATTGDLVNWLAKEGIPGISVLLTTHDSPEIDKNMKGFKALLNYYK